MVESVEPGIRDHLASRNNTEKCDDDDVARFTGESPMNSIAPS
jgi:hypothetical protein